MARVTPEDRLSCNQLLKFLRGNDGIRSEFYIGRRNFWKHYETVKMIETGLENKIKNLDDDLTI